MIGKWSLPLCDALYNYTNIVHTEQKIFFRPKQMETISSTSGFDRYTI
jgi:hypothetical protein